MKAGLKNQLFIYLLLIGGITASIYMEIQQLMQEDRIVTERKSIDSFEEIVLGVPGTIYFIDSEDSMITLEGPAAVIEGLEFSNTDGELSINSDTYATARSWKQLFFNKAYQLNIYIPVTNVNEYRVAGLGELIGSIDRSDDKLLIQSFGLMNVHIYRDPIYNQTTSDELSSMLVSLW
ncbi:MAG: DUF2807 domain-containing protein [Bacteroidota bacterium]